MKIEIETRFEVNEEIWVMVDNFPCPGTIDGIDYRFASGSCRPIQAGNSGLWYDVNASGRIFRAREDAIAKTRLELRDKIFADFSQA